MLPTFCGGMRPSSLLPFPPVDSGCHPFSLRPDVIQLWIQHYVYTLGSMLSSLNASLLHSAMFSHPGGNRPGLSFVAGPPCRAYQSIGNRPAGETSIFLNHDPPILRGSSHPGEEYQSWRSPGGAALSLMTCLIALPKLEETVLSW